MNTEKCSECGQEYTFGDWPLCPHGSPHGMHTFKPYIDYHMLDHPVEITSWAQRQTLARIHGLVEKEPPSNSKLAERRDKCEWIRRERERCRQNQ
jgi:hypothetical protein